MSLMSVHTNVRSNPLAGQGGGSDLGTELGEVPMPRKRRESYDPEQGRSLMERLGLRAREVRLAGWGADRARMFQRLGYVLRVIRGDEGIDSVAARAAADGEPMDKRQIYNLEGLQDRKLAAKRREVSLTSVAFLSESRGIPFGETWEYIVGRRASIPQPATLADGTTVLEALDALSPDRKRQVLEFIEYNLQREHAERRAGIAPVAARPSPELAAQEAAARTLALDEALADIDAMEREVESEGNDGTAQGIG